MAVTTVPIVADLIGTLPVSRWVYYCVDDFSKWPGLDQEPLDRMERQLVARADELIAVSETLRQRLADMGRESHLLTHGVDLELWSRRDALAPPQLGQHHRPLIVFWGMVDRRLDTGFLKRLSEDLTEGTIVLVGPEQDPDPAFRSMTRVVRLPAMSFDQLPALAQEAAVLVMPYADLPVTRAMQPLKLKEYLATDRPVVVADLPSTRPWSEALDLVRTSEEFSHAVRLRLRSGLPPPQRTARTGLVSESWTAKSEAFERLILGLEHELPAAARGSGPEPNHFRAIFNRLDANLAQRRGTRRTPLYPPFARGEKDQTPPTFPPLRRLTITHNYSRSLLPARKPAASKVRS